MTYITLIEAASTYGRTLGSLKQLIYTKKVKGEKTEEGDWLIEKESLDKYCVGAKLHTEFARAKFKKLTQKSEEWYYIQNKGIGFFR